MYLAPQGCPRVSVALTKVLSQALIRIAIVEKLIEVGGVGQK